MSMEQTGILAYKGSTRAAQVAGKSVNEWAEEPLTTAAQATIAAAPDGAHIPVLATSPSVPSPEIR